LKQCLPYIKWKLKREGSPEPPIPQKEETQLKYFDQRTHRTEALLRPTIRFCQALMLILAASVCSGQTVTNTIKIDLTFDGVLAGTFTEIKGILPQPVEPSSTTTKPLTTTAGQLILRRRVNPDLMVSNWYSSGQRRALYLTIYDYTVPLTKVWLQNAVPVSVSYSTEVEAGRMVVVETVVLDYAAMQRVSV